MISLLKKIFINNWIRKLISILLSTIIWFTIDNSLTKTKAINTVSVRIINISNTKTINGLQASGCLNKKITLKITGKKSYIHNLSSRDIEVVIDASLIEKESVVHIEKKHLISLNPKLNIKRHISKIAPKTITISTVNIVKDTIPVYITRPIGEAPKGFQFIDIWPYNLNVTVNGQDEVIKKLKTKGLKLTFNLNDISSSDIEKASHGIQKDLVSFYIPDEWKTVNFPSISDQPITIDDPNAKLLRIDFVRSDRLPLKFKIPINIFFSAEYIPSVDPSTLYISQNDLIKSVNGIKVLNKQLYTKGVSKLFVKIISDMVSFSVNLTNTSKDNHLDWSIQLINQQALEDKYVNYIVTESIDDDTKDMHPRMRQEYLRNRFRSYMNRFKFFTEDDKQLSLDISLLGNEILIQEVTNN